MQFVRKDSIPSLLCNPPPTPEILLRRDVPPARIFASRRSLRARRACSARASAAAAELSIVSVMVVIVELLGVDDLIFGVCACVEWEVGVSVCGGFACDVGWLRWGNVGLNELSGNLLSYRLGGGGCQAGWPKLSGTSVRASWQHQALSFCTASISPASTQDHAKYGNKKRGLFLSNQQQAPSTQSNS